MSYHHLCSSPSSSSSFFNPQNLSSSSPANPIRKRFQIINHGSSIQQQQHHHPFAKTFSKTSKKLWVNPTSATAPMLPLKSHDMRYASLIKIAQSLNSCTNPTLHHVSLLFNAAFSPKANTTTISEKDAVVVLNNMSNPIAAPIALSLLLERCKPSRDVILYNVVMKVFRKCGDFEGARNWFDEMLERGVKPDNITFYTLISCARMASLPNKAVELFERMPEFGLTPDDVIYSAMIDAYGRAGNVDMALSLYDRAKTEKWRIDPVAFSTVIRIRSASGDFDGCLNVYEEMKAFAVKPNLTIYNTLLHAMGRAKRPWQAKSIYRELTSDGFVPNRGTYVALLRAFARARYGEDTLVIYKQMKEKGMELNVVLYNTLLAMCADVGCVDEAVEIFEDMKNSRTCKPDSWTFSSLITIYSCSGKVAEAEEMLKKMLEAGFEPNIFVLTSLIQCYGKANRIDDVVRTFDRILDLGINPDERFCGCLLNVMTQTPKEELGKLTICIEKVNPKLGHVVKLLVEGQTEEGEFKRESGILFGLIGADVKKAYSNCLIDLCVNLNLLERACELLDLGMTLEIYTDIQSKTSTQWSLHLKSLSLGAALTALHVWMNDLSKAMEEEEEEEFPSLLGINTGHGKHRYSERGLAGVFESHLKELGAPFHEVPDKAGWFLTTKIALKPWLESRNSSQLVPAI